ncbi:surface carbohydrate biosynthesis protein [Thiopseudomonas acetoxidans]|uniref:Capsule polysaccharide biosynthesis n=1 Tax=Thiopseudomonas acetoxidans TaxID=3041622 RepID=A0ABT7SRU8_9GAMM|nr:surface carbohydrate biosynthesis protein [Thiopseudomonas sp. CY1220]MDM7858927.1 hypothetical protein [Thiopseudomonas sp. CY1220]
MNNSVFIPIEIMRREYISKLLLAVQLVMRGMPVIIGHKSPVLKLALNAAEPGVLFYKSSRGGGNEELFDALQKKGFLIVAQDEEAGIIFDDFSDFYTRRTSLSQINTLDMFFTWGEDDYKFLGSKFNSSKSSIVYNLGALRSCFWGDFGMRYYSKDIKHLKNRFGDYVLLVSNLATYNQFLNKKQSLEHLSQYESFDIKESDAQYLAEKKIFNQYLKLIKVLTEQLHKTVIIRPHPAESVDAWERSVKGINKAHVEKDGELLSWILGSEFIIQNNCTSAIEAACANIPVITYADEVNDLTILSYGKENIPNKISVHAFGINEFVAAVNDLALVWSEEKRKEKREAFLNKKLTNYGTMVPAEKIAERIIIYTGKPNPNGNVGIGKDTFMYDLYELYRCSRFRPKSIGVIMDINKRETLSKAKIKHDLKGLMEAMGIKVGIKTKRVAPNSFYIYPQEFFNEK